MFLVICFVFGLILVLFIGMIVVVFFLVVNCKIVFLGIKLVGLMCL